MTNADPHEFIFDLDKGIRDQLLEAIAVSPKLQLCEGVGPSQSGLYAISYKDRLVYLGKATKSFTKSGRTLKARLAEHRAKLLGRPTIEFDQIVIQYLTFQSDWWVVAGEVALIRHLSPPWNASGFGSKVPGSGRPGTARVSKFDLEFPSVPKL